jgi:tRNA A37 threonylcarbamoyladenosine dehydratase
VAVVGLGGVGSWAAEALCRCGVGALVLVDADDVCASNANRQVMAGAGSVGRMKAEALAERLRDINPEVRVTAVLDFVTPATAGGYFAEPAPFAEQGAGEQGAGEQGQHGGLLRQHGGLLLAAGCVVDCVDCAEDKAALISCALAAGVPVVTAGGAANLLDPSKIRTTDLARARDDPLLQWTRRRLRRDYGFAKGPGDGEPNRHRPRKWGVPAVWSEEVPAGPPPAAGGGSLRACDGRFGSAVFVTGSFGFAAAKAAIDILLADLPPGEPPGEP